MHPELPALLAEIHREGGTYAELLRGAVSRGVPLGELVGRVEFSDTRELFESTGDGPLLVLDWHDEGDWLETLCDVVGGDDAAQAVLDQGFGWMAEVDVAEHRAEARARQELHRSGEEPYDAARLYAAVEVARRRLSAWEVDRALTHVIEQWPISTLTQLVWLPAQLLLHRGPWARLLDEAAAAVGPDIATHWISRLLGRTSDPEVPPEIRHLKLAWELHGAAGASRWETVRRITTGVPPAVWAPAARALGFPASQCVLLLLDAGTPIADAAATMAEAGWSDAELLEGLRENGVGPSPALDALRRSGWSAIRMAEALRAGGALEPEVREALRALGVPHERVQKLLAT